MTLAVVRSLDAPRRLGRPRSWRTSSRSWWTSTLLAVVGAGVTDGHGGRDRSVVFEFIRFLGRPVWTAGPEDADRFLAHSARSGPGQLDGAAQGVGAGAVLRFLVARYQGDIHALTGHVVEQLIDEYNRPAKADYGALRDPAVGRRRSTQLFARVARVRCPTARKYLPAARDYLAASLWRRVGLRISETVMLDIRDWRPDLGEYGKLHVRFGKGSRGRGPKTRLVPAINRPTRCWTGGWLTCGTSSAMTGTTPTRRCCRQRAPRPDTGRCSRAGDRRAAGRAGRRGRRGGCRPGRAADAARAAALLRLVAVCPRHGPQGGPGAARATSGCPPRPGTSTSTTTTSSRRGRPPTTGSRPGSVHREGGETMRWNLRMKAAERGIWKSTEMRRLLAEAGLEISAGKMSALWTGTPVTIRLDDLDVICAVLDCTPADLLIREPDKVAARRPAKAAGRRASPVTPGLGRHRSDPPA